LKLIASAFPQRRNEAYGATTCGRDCELSDIGVERQSYSEVDRQSRQVVIHGIYYGGRSLEDTNESDATD